MAKSLFVKTEDATVQRQVFKKLGLYKNQELHIALEEVWETFMRQQLQIAEAKARLK